MSTRVAVFTEILPPANDEIAHVSYDLLRSLAEQQHEICVFSTYVPGAELPPAQSRIEILRPFRTWSLFELPRLLPLMLRFRPDLIHIIHPRAPMLNFGWAKLTATLPALARINQRTPVVTSLYDQLRPTQETKLMPLLRSSDLITVSQNAQRTELSANALLRDRDVRFLPLTGFQMPEAEGGDVALSPAVASFIAEFPKFIYVPGRLEAHLGVGEILTHLRALASRGYGVLVGSSPSRLDIGERRQLEAALLREAWGGQVLCTGTLSLAAEDSLLRKAWLTSLFSLAPESLSLSRYSRAAARGAAMLLLSRAQANSDTLPWKDEQNALIAENADDISARLGQVEKDPGLSARLRNGIHELAGREMSDRPTNLMSRWYADLLASSV